MTMTKTKTTTVTMTTTRSTAMQPTASDIARSLAEAGQGGRYSLEALSLILVWIAAAEEDTGRGLDREPATICREWVEIPPLDYVRDAPHGKCLLQDIATAYRVARADGQSVAESMDSAAEANGLCLAAEAALAALAALAGSQDPDAADAADAIASALAADAAEIAAAAASDMGFCAAQTESGTIVTGAY